MYMILNSGTTGYQQLIPAYRSSPSHDFSPDETIYLNFVFIIPLLIKITSSHFYIISILFYFAMLSFIQRICFSPLHIMFLNDTCYSFWLQFIHLLCCIIFLCEDELRGIVPSFCCCKQCSFEYSSTCCFVEGLGSYICKQKCQLKWVKIFHCREIGISLTFLSTLFIVCNFP